MNRTQENVLLVVLGCIALLLLGWVGMQLSQGQAVAVADDPSPTRDINPEPTFFVTAPPLTTREPAEATRIAELTENLQEAWQVSPTPAPECELIQIDLSNGSVFLLKLDRPMTIWYGANEGTNPSFGPIIDSEFVFQGNTFRDYAIPHNSFFVFGYEFKFEPGDYEISVRKWQNELGYPVSPASYELRLCP